MAHHILIADDSKSLREMLSDFLSEFGYETRLARDGIEAVTSIERQRPDLLILDIEMPRLDGFGTLDILQQREPDLPVIVICEGDRALQEAARRLGGECCLAKPFAVPDLIARMEQLLIARS